MVWMKVDKLTKKCTIHADTQCKMLSERKEKDFKGIGELKRDGGWLFFDNVREAKEYYLSNFDNYKLVEHCSANNDEIYIINKTKKQSSRDSDEIEIPSFNSVTDHYRKIMGVPKKVNLNPTKLPKWLRIFYYTIVVFMVFYVVVFMAYVIFFKTGK